MKSLHMSLIQLTLIFSGFIIIAAPMATMIPGSKTVVNYGQEYVASGTVKSVTYSSKKKETTFIVAGSKSKKDFFLFRYMEGQGGSKIKSLIDSLLCLKGKNVKITVRCDKKSKTAYSSSSYLRDSEIHVFRLGNSFNECRLEALSI